MTNTKVVDLKKLCRIVVDNFFIWNHLSNKITFEFLTFKIRIFETTSDGETTKIKGVDHETLYNFVVDNFSFEIINPRKIMFEFRHIWILNSSNDIGWRNDQNGSRRSQKVIKLCSWQVFHLNSKYSFQNQINYPKSSDLWLPNEVSRY
jgi:hypothetical protein